MILKGAVRAVSAEENVFVHDALGVRYIAVRVEYELAGVGSYGRLTVTLPIEDAPQVGDEILVEVKNVNPL